MEEDIYEVKRIINHSYIDGKLHYLVEWKGYPKPSDYTWEPYEHLENCQRIIKLYCNKFNEGKPLEEELVTKGAPIIPLANVFNPQLIKDNFPNKKLSIEMPHIQNNVGGFQGIRSTFFEQHADFTTKTGDICSLPLDEALLLFPDEILGSLLCH